MKQTVLIGVIVMGLCGIAPAEAQKEKAGEARSAFTQTFAIPSKGLIRKSEKDALLRRMNHPSAPKEKKQPESRKIRR